MKLQDRKEHWNSDWIQVQYDVVPIKVGKLHAELDAPSLPVLAWEDAWVGPWTLWEWSAEVEEKRKWGEGILGEAGMADRELHYWCCTGILWVESTGLSLMMAVVDGGWWVHEGWAKVGRCLQPHPWSVFNGYLLFLCDILNSTYCVISGYRLHIDNWYAFWAKVHTYVIQDKYQVMHWKAQPSPQLRPLPFFAGWAAEKLPRLLAKALTQISEDEGA